MGKQNKPTQHCDCGGELKQYTMHHKRGRIVRYYQCLSCAMKWVICETPDGEIIERRHAKEYSRDLRKHEARGTVRIQTLCRGCRNAYADKCSYHSRRHTPVDGWKVETSELYGERTHTVIECPNYESDRRKA